MFIVRVVQQNGTIIEIPAMPEASLLSLLRTGGFILPSPCGGKGVCGKCKVKVVAGAEALQQPYQNTKALSPEEWAKGYRLSCRMKVTEDLLVEMPLQEESTAKILTSGEYHTELDPYVTMHTLPLTPPDLSDQRGDVDRLEAALYPARIDRPSLIVQLSEVLRQNAFNVTATVFGNAIIEVKGSQDTGAFYGVAVDVGTTTLVGVLINLSNGQEECVYSALNPQKIYGDDVITRIDYTIEHPEGMSVLRSLLIKEIEQMLVYFTQQTGICAASIYHMVFVGNTVMMHILAGIPVKHIAVSPFIPAISRSLELRASDQGITICPEGRLTIVPMVAGYVGADTIGAVLASGMTESNKCSLLIDIGTNGEIALGNQDRILACSTAAGPAFEGGHIRYGLGGVSGAINRIEMTENHVEISTIGDRPARGICGSGVVDGAAQLKKRHLLESYGRMLSKEEVSEMTPGLAMHMGELDGKPAFLIASKEEGAENDIYITQRDIREIQLAKGAIAAGIRILMNEFGVSYEEIDKVYLAGGFGNYIDYDHAVEIGLIPLELREKILPIGNGALTGAKMVLTNKDCLRKTEELKRIIQYIELSSRADFQNLFVDYMEF